MRESNNAVTRAAAFTCVTTSFCIGVLCGLGCAAESPAAPGVAPTRERSTAAPADGFVAALPIWPTGRSLEKNLQVGFRTVIDGAGKGQQRISLRVTGSTLYRATLNGAHIGYGPARGPHGHYRIDVWDLTGKLGREPGKKDVIALEVAGYNVNSYYTLDQPSFLQAEVLEGSKVLAATGREGSGGFTAAIPGERLQKVQRYSFQRPFSEVYRIRPDHDRWKMDSAAQGATPTPAGAAGPLEPVACSADTRTLRYLPRRAPYPDFRVRGEPDAIAAGSVEPLEKIPDLWKDRSLTAIGPQLGGYPESELETIPSIDMQKLGSRPDGAWKPAKVRSGEALTLDAMQYRILDFGLNNTGFIGLTVTCAEPSRLVLAFDEVLRGGDVDFKRLGCVNLVVHELPPGTWALESFEPYTFRYLKVIALSTRCEVRDPFLREYSCSGVDAGTFRSSDARLDRLFEAGRETFRQNAIDTFMDCPSRERAGWLCDSFFTARVEPDLRGVSTIEQVLVENFLLPESFEFLPKGMLPMCYPADHNDGVFIPNWAMWFVVQLEEYLSRSGDEESVRRLKPRVMALLDFLKTFRNADGLLERLPSWVFVEWSAANDHVQDVNYPSNMLYAGTLSAAARLYGMDDLARQAEAVRETVRRQSFDGEFFVDNAKRSPDGKLEVTRNRTEVCQYFAFFFEVAAPDKHPVLWNALRTQFGPRRAKENAFPEVGLANSFIGNMLRIELLSRAGLSQQILDESIDYLLYMAERTGTLWENVGDYASCNHGFASHIVHTLFRDVLGARDVDRRQKKVVLRFAPLGLEWCEGTIPTPHGPVKLSWRRKGDVIAYSCTVPDGYTVEVENPAGLRLERTP